MAATLIMCFAFSLSVMAAPSPEDEYYNTSTEQEKVDEKTQIDDDEFDKDEKPAKNENNNDINIININNICITKD